MPTRTFAILPAAGHSRRMGQPKLLLPFRDARLIDAVLNAWVASSVERTVIVVRSGDNELHDACSKWPVDVLRPKEDPVDMKASIQAGLRYIRDTFSPAPTDTWLTAPADLPHIGAPLIDRLIAESRQTANIVAPMFGDHPGHPILLPWSMAEDVFAIPESAGLKWLMDSQPVSWISFPANERLLDADTPEDFRRFK